MHAEIWSGNMRDRPIVRHKNNNKTDVTCGGSVNTSSTSSGSGRRPVTTFSEQGIEQLLKMEMEPTRSPKTSVGFQRITQRYVPEARRTANQTRSIQSPMAIYPVLQGAEYVNTQHNATAISVWLLSGDDPQSTDTPTILTEVFRDFLSTFRRMPEQCL
jgi:hypothetical protein